MIGGESNEKRFERNDWLLTNTEKPPPPPPPPYSLVYSIFVDDTYV